MVGPARALHYVFKIGNRKSSADFYQRTLLMKPLRHEEFTEGCAASCNGPYDGHWSKTMIGYADENSSFVLELTYNYNVKSYELGNDFHSMTIKRKDVYAAVQAAGCGTPASDGKGLAVKDPEGHTFVVVDEDVEGPNPVTEVALNVADLGNALAYWADFLSFKVAEKGDGYVTLTTGKAGEAALRLVQLPSGTKLERGTGYGRIAFACPGEQLKQLQEDVKAAGYKVHTPYVSLDTPGKATVQVVILQDPDDHEICFVGDDGFRDLSQVDGAASKLLADAIEADKSEEWHAKMAEREAKMKAHGV